MQGWWAASYIVLWALVIVLCVIVVALARQIGTLHLRLGPRGALEIDAEGPALGTAPPPRPVTTVEGATVTVGGPGERQLLMFVSIGCRVCEQVLPALPAVARVASLRPVVLADADERETSAAFSGARSGMTVAAASDVVRTYDVPGTPFVVMLDEGGIVRAKGLVNNLEQLEGLVDTADRRASGEDHHRRAS